MEEFCKIVNNGGYLAVTMPDGQVIPGQISLKIQNDYPDHNVVVVEFTSLMLIPADEFKVLFDK
jgi:hypothetical protein